MEIDASGEVDHSKLVTPSKRDYGSTNIETLTNHCVSVHSPHAIEDLAGLVLLLFNRIAHDDCIDPVGEGSATKDNDGRAIDTSAHPSHSAADDTMADGAGE